MRIIGTWTAGRAANGWYVLEEASGKMRVYSQIRSTKLVDELIAERKAALCKPRRKKR